MIWYGLNLRLKQLRTNLILVRLVPHFFDTSPGGSIRDLKTSQAAEFRKNTVRQVEDDMGWPGMTSDLGWLEHSHEDAIESMDLDYWKLQAVLSWEITKGERVVGNKWKWTRCRAGGNQCPINAIVVLFAPLELQSSGHAGSDWLWLGERPGRCRVQIIDCQHLLKRCLTTFSFKQFLCSYSRILLLLCFLKAPRLKQAMRTHKIRSEVPRRSKQGHSTDWRCIPELRKAARELRKAAQAKTTSGTSVWAVFKTPVAWWLWGILHHCTTQLYVYIFTYTYVCIYILYAYRISYIYIEYIYI